MTDRVEVTYLQRPRGMGRVVTSTSVVDCRRHKRRHVGTETVDADDKRTQRPGMNSWRDIASYEIAHGIFADYCRSVAASAPK